MTLRIKNKKQFLKEYERTATAYDIARSGSFMGKIVDYFQRKFVLKTIKKNNCKKILEAGCGTGRILHFLAQKNLNCT